MVDRETGCGFVLPESSLSTFFFCEEGICFVPARTGNGTPGLKLASAGLLVPLQADF